MTLENGKPVQYIAEMTMMEEEAVFAWAADHKLLVNAVEKLIKEGSSYRIT